jgi:hypothetical protein
MAAIEKLPPELLETIFGYFCHDTTRNEMLIAPDPRYGLAISVWSPYSNLLALAALCLTSRHLNHIATRLLYRHLYSRRWWHLATTLLARPDLACHARSLRISNQVRPTKNDIDEELRKYFIERGHRRYLERLPDPKGERRSERISRMMPIDFSGVNWNPADPWAYAVVDVLVSLCPQIESLGLQLHWCKGEFNFTAPLPNLQHISLAIPDDDTLVPIVDNPTIQKAAQSLTSLAVVFGGPRSFLRPNVKYPNLKTLDYRESYMNAQRLDEILRQCPNLETFRYQMGHKMNIARAFQQFGVREAGELIIRHLPRIKSVHLHCRGSADGDGCWREDEVDRLRDELTQRGVQFTFSDPELDALARGG